MHRHPTAAAAWAALLALALLPGCAETDFRHAPYPFARLQADAAQTEEGRMSGFSWIPLANLSLTGFTRELQAPAEPVAAREADASTGPAAPDSARALEYFALVDSDYYGPLFCAQSVEVSYFRPDGQLFAASRKESAPWRLWGRELRVSRQPTGWKYESVQRVLFGLVPIYWSSWLEPDAPEFAAQEEWIEPRDSN